MAPIVPLATICREFFGMSYKKARELATVNGLQVPTFPLVKAQ
jgi:hypothetical protein